MRLGVSKESTPCASEQEAKTTDFFTAPHGCVSHPCKNIPKNGKSERCGEGGSSRREELGYLRETFPGLKEVAQ
jgi:hypothetical protein